MASLRSACTKAKGFSAVAMRRSHSRKISRQVARRSSHFSAPMGTSHRAQRPAAALRMVTLLPRFAVRLNSGPASPMTAESASHRTPSALTDCMRSSGRQSRQFEESVPRASALVSSSVTRCPLPITAGSMSGLSDSCIGSASFLSGAGMMLGTSLTCGCWCFLQEGMAM